MRLLPSPVWVGITQSFSLPVELGLPPSLVLGDRISPRRLSWSQAFRLELEPMPPRLLGLKAADHRKWDASASITM